MRTLVKLGGALLDDARLRAALATQIVKQVQSGAHITVVHGGGKRMTQYLADRGIESRFVNGLRVTTPETMDAVLKVLAGSINQELAAALNAAGAKAVGLTGVDANLAEAEPLDPALGLVGRVTRVNPELLDILVERAYIPVVACVAGDRQGRLYNVNADQMASACAVGWRARRLIFLTDIAGVLDREGQVRRSLTPDECRQLVAAGVASGGMQAKLDAATLALERGVEEVEIAPGASTDVLARLQRGETVGTRIVRAQQGAASYD